MKKSFTLGAVSGITALAIGFPLAAQYVGAQEASSTSSAKSTESGFFRGHDPLLQEDVQDMIDHDNAFLLHIDAFIAIQKEAIQNHRIALEAVADLTDETERNDAVRAAHEAMREEIRAAIEANPDLQAAMPFGTMGHGGKGGGRGMRMKGFMHGMLEEKLGMTKEELKAAIDSGKTIEEIAEEKGVELPARPQMRGRGEASPN